MRLAGAAEEGKKIPRIGILLTTSPSAIHDRVDAFRSGLRDLGYIEGQSMVLEWRYADARLDRLPDLAAELVRAKVDVIVTGGPSATRPAKDATSTIPIVMANSDDPVGTGFGASLARPGRNVTGLSTHYPEISAKQLELLKAIIPKLSRVAVMSNPATPGTQLRLKEKRGAAQPLRLQLQTIEVRSPQDFEDALLATVKGRAGAPVVTATQIFTANRKRIVDTVASSGLTAIYAWGEFVEAGGLMSYGASQTDIYRRAAVFVHKILNGSKPGELPVEQPTKFELVINRKTARALGLTIPKTLLLRADRIIE